LLWRSNPHYAKVNRLSISDLKRIRVSTAIEIFQANGRPNIAITPCKVH